MSTVFDLDDVAHWVSHTKTYGQLPDLVLVTAHTWCYLTRRFQRGNPLLRDGVPTCLMCVDKHDRFRLTERGVDGPTREWLHKLQYGDGTPVP